MAADAEIEMAPGRMRLRAVAAEFAPGQIGLWDGISIIIGIVIGVTIFKAPPLIFSNVSGPWQGMAVWVLGGVLSIVGGLCYAELATAYPRSGGDYVYLTRAYGPWVGFIFGWAQLAAILTGSIGALAYVFADYALEIWGGPMVRGVWYAVGAVLVLTLLNLCGMVLGRAAQNILTVAKMIGVGGILAAGLLWGGGASLLPQQAVTGPGLGLAFILVLYAYGGWNDAAFVAAELRNRRRNIPLALILGTGAITLIYLLINMAYLWGLGFEGLRASRAPAGDVFKLMMGDWGGRGMSLLVMVSALGCINGLIFTGSRVYATLGADHTIFSWLGRWHPRLRTPLWSFLSQAAVVLIMILIVGTAAGRNGLDSLLQCAGLSALPWDRFGGGFGTLISGTAPVFWFFFLLSGLSLFVLRIKDPHTERPFLVPLYPLLPLVFCLTSIGMLYSSVNYAKGLALLGIVPVLLGLPLYIISRRMTIKTPTSFLETKQ
ncbi:MAG: amino acid permease [Planctomycetota bacterium]